MQVQMTRVELECITMVGHEFVVFERSGASLFPHGDVQDGEAPAEAARRVIQEWTGTTQPKLELVDLKASKGLLLLVFRAMLMDEPQGKVHRHDRGSLPEKVGTFTGREVEDLLKTSLNYKLTRIG